MKGCTIYFDGACEPKNPGGTGGWGFVILNDGKEVATGSGNLGKGPWMTNNIAEYSALVEGLKRASELGYDFFDIYGDSNLVVNMVSRRWGWKKGVYVPHKDKPHLLKLLQKAHVLLEGKEFSIQWIPRERNERADELSKMSL